MAWPQDEGDEPNRDVKRRRMDDVAKGKGSKGSNTGEKGNDGKSEEDDTKDPKSFNININAAAEKGDLVLAESHYGEMESAGVELGKNHNTYLE